MHCTESCFVLFLTLGRTESHLWHLGPLLCHAGPSVEARRRSCWGLWAPEHVYLRSCSAHAL